MACPVRRSTTPLDHLAAFHPSSGAEAGPGALPAQEDASRLNVRIQPRPRAGVGCNAVLGADSDS